MKRAHATSSLMNDAHGIIKRRLLRGQVRLGQSISRRQLASELGMSFLPVTIALLRLEYEGFLESRPRAGTRLRIPSPEDIRGHYVVREALEVQAAKLFVANASAKERDDLKKIAVQVDSAALSPDPTQFVQVHQRFHKRIADGARCQALSETIEQVLALESAWLCAVDRQPQREPARRHQLLAESMAEGDPERAADAIREHIAVGLTYLMERLKPAFARRVKDSNTFTRSRPS